MAHKNQSVLVDVLTQLYEFVDDFWLLGLVLSVIFTILTALTLNWAATFNVPVSDDAVSQVLAPIYYLRWLVVFAPTIPMILFSRKTYQSWSRHR